MTVEGGSSVWKMGLDLLADRLQIVACKSFGWFAERTPTGETVWRYKLVPFGEGSTRFAEAFGYLRQAGFDGVLTVTSEYQGPLSWRELSTDEIVARTRIDLAYLRERMAEAGLSG